MIHNQSDTIGEGRPLSSEEEEEEEDDDDSPSASVIIEAAV